MTDKRKELPEEVELRKPTAVSLGGSGGTGNPPAPPPPPSPPPPPEDEEVGG